MIEILMNFPLLPKPPPCDIFPFLFIFIHISSKAIML